LRVVPRRRGSWIVATEHDDVLSEHATATEAEMAAVAVCARVRRWSSMTAITGAVDAVDQRRVIERLAPLA
jgi:hypothetical protein